MSAESVFYEEDNMKHLCSAHGWDSGGECRGEKSRIAAVFDTTARHYRT